MAGPGLDNDYLNEITGLTGDDDTIDNSPSAFRSSEGEQQSNEPTATPANKATVETPPEVRTGEPSADPATTQAPIEGLKRNAGGHLTNQRGDIVNEQGQVVAPQGTARRVYEQAARTRGQLETATTELTQLRQQMREVQYLNGIPQQFGLSNDEVAHALDIEARIKRGDVVSVAKDVVAMLAAKGHNISELLGNSVGDSVDMKAINLLLEQKLAPFTQQTQQNEQSRQSEIRAREQYSQFVDDNEYADVQGDIIVAMKQRTGGSMQQAYNSVRAFAIQNGLDMSQPLGPQIEAIQSQQQQPTQQQPQIDARRPMPNGVPTRDNGVQPIKPVYADPDDDWGTIIRRAMPGRAN